MYTFILTIILIWIIVWRWFSGFVGDYSGLFADL